LRLYVFYKWNANYTLDYGKGISSAMSNLALDSRREDNRDGTYDDVYMFILGVLSWNYITGIGLEF
jgi:hypothetical protein